MPDTNIIQTASASWETPYSDEVWRRLEAAKAEPPRILGDASGVVVLGVALPDETDPRVARVFVHHHRDSDDRRLRDELRWTLTVHPAPAGEPPAELLSEHERVGGRKGLSELLAECIPPTVPPVAQFRVTLNLERLRYKCKVLPLELKRGDMHDFVLNLGRRTYVEQVGYRFDGGANGLEEVAIIYIHKDDIFSVTVRANGLLKLRDDRWLPYADEVGDLVASTFFINHGSKA